MVGPGKRRQALGWLKNGDRPELTSPRCPGERWSRCSLPGDIRHPVVPGTERYGDPVPQAHLILHVESQSLLRLVIERAGDRIGGKTGLIDVVDVDDIKVDAAKLADPVPAIIVPPEQPVLDHYRC